MWKWESKERSDWCIVLSAQALGTTSAARRDECSLALVLQGNAAEWGVTRLHFTACRRHHSFGANLADPGHHKARLGHLSTPSATFDFQHRISTSTRLSPHLHLTKPQCRPRRRSQTALTLVLMMAYVQMYLCNCTRLTLDSRGSGRPSTIALYVLLLLNEWSILTTPEALSYDDGSWSAWQR